MPKRVREETDDDIDVGDKIDLLRNEIKSLTPILQNILNEVSNYRKQAQAEARRYFTTVEKLRGDYEMLVQDLKSQHEAKLERLSKKSGNGN